MSERFSRLSLMYGEDAVKRLAGCHVAVFGVGGVGGYVVEALARSGVGALTLVDGDTVAESNINRQIAALSSTLGKAKVQAVKERVLDINPACKVTALKLFFMPDTPEEEIDFSGLDYVADAVDTVTAKLEIIKRAKAARVPVISCMGAGNKQNPMGFEVADISKTSVCPLARVMRLECKKRGLTDVKCVFSKEPPLSHAAEGEKRLPASNSFTPPAAGLLLASEIIKELMAR